MQPNDWVAFVGGTFAIIGVVLGVMGWYIRITVERVVAQHTQAIQPGWRNGGKSLTDVSEKIDRIARRLDDLERQK